MYIDINNELLLKFCDFVPLGLIWNDICEMGNIPIRSA